MLKGDLALSFIGQNVNSFDEQKVFANRVKALAYERYGYIPKATVITFGCQQNVSDSEHLKGMLVSMGYTLTEEINQADFIIFNTYSLHNTYFSIFLC